MAKKKSRKKRKIERKVCKQNLVTEVSSGFSKFVIYGMMVKKLGTLRHTYNLTILWNYKQSVIFIVSQRYSQISESCVSFSDHSKTLKYLSKY